MLFVAHQLHCRVWQAVRCSSVTLSHLAGRSLLVTYTAYSDGVAFGNEPGCTRFRCRDCEPVGEAHSYTVAIASRRDAHSYVVAIASQSDCALLRCGAWKPVGMRSPWVVAYRAARQTVALNPTVSGGAPCDTLPCCQPEERFGIVKAQRSGRTHRSPHRVHLRCDPPRCASRPERGTLPERSSLRSPVC
jgi:hypothetical protein